jgi:hypothetical protein
MDSVTVIELEDEQEAKDRQPQGDEATQDDPSEQADDAGIADIDPNLVDALMELRRKFEISWSPKRRALVQRALKAFEYLKNNPYSIFQYDNFEYNPILAVLTGNRQADDLEMYAYNDNVYQMLALSFIAVGSNNQDKTRYMPVNPDNELDLTIADKASTMMADIERRNDISKKSKLELLNLWCTGSYFSYVRNVTDSDRWGTTKEPVTVMVDVTALPDRFVCPQCGNVVPLQHTNPFSRTVCDQCKKPLSQADFYPEEKMSIPMQVGEEEVANTATAIDVYNLLYVDADPDAMELAESPILDLKSEVKAGAIRAAYPHMRDKITAGVKGSTTGDTLDQIARDRLTSPNSMRSGLAEELRGEYSRCWFQPWAFDQIDDKNIADQLKERFPKGCKLVSWAGDIPLEVIEDRMLDHWSWCGTIDGLGLFPFGVGDVALSVQDRINDTANNIHAYMDRLAFPHVLADVDAINISAMNTNSQSGGQVIPVKRVKNGVGVREPLQNYLWQPNYHIDPKMYEYGQQLLMLAQLLTGIQPQIFGAGTTRGVDTATGQEQMLNTAMGRLMLFFNQIRSEHAVRSRNAIKCMARSIVGSRRVIVPGEADGEWKNEYILETDVQGDFEAYPESDQGFPASYAEMRDRLQQLLESMKLNPFAAEILQDPDNAAIVAKYLLPDGIRIPGAAGRSKVKNVLQQLAQQEPIVTPGPNGPVVLPSIQPDPDFDDMDLIVSLAKAWAQENYKLQLINPKGFDNVRAYFRLASQYQAQAKTAQALQMQQAAAGAAGQKEPPSQGVAA